MTQEQTPAFEQALGVLRQFRGTRRRTSRAEHCELCGAELYPDHPHLVELASHQLVCACDACAMLFDGMERSKYKRVPRRIEFFPEFVMSSAQWDSLYIPINLAFFFRSSIEGRPVALYPSPAGAIESLLTLESWNEIVACNAPLKGMRSDVEALLVNRIDVSGSGRNHRTAPANEATAAEYYIAPIDACYKLVGVIRSNWKGLSGGAEVWSEIDRFFADLHARAEVVRGGQDA